MTELEKAILAIENGMLGDFDFDDGEAVKEVVLAALRAQAERDKQTADVAPVVHARWITKVRREHYPSGEPYETDYCSTCGNRGSLEHRFCPNCGARMDLEADNGKIQ